MPHYSERGTTSNSNFPLRSVCAEQKNKNNYVCMCSIVSTLRPNENFKKPQRLDNGHSSQP